MKSENVFDMMEKKFRTLHISRIFQQKIQSIETSTLHLDLLSCFKRINSHSVDIAKAMCGEWYSLKSTYTTDENDSKDAVDEEGENNKDSAKASKDRPEDKSPENWY
jgi:phosphate:Na+ symporter